MKNYLVIAILIELLCCDKVSATKLAEKYEVSPRTIYRYLDNLECAGVPTKTILGKNGGIAIDPSFKLATTFLTVDEKMYLKSILTKDQSDLKDSISKKLKL